MILEQLRICLVGKLSRAEFFVLGLFGAQDFLSMSTFGPCNESVRFSYFKDIAEILYSGEFYLSNQSIDQF